MYGVSGVRIEWSGLMRVRSGDGGVALRGASGPFSTRRRLLMHGWQALNAELDLLMRERDTGVLKLGRERYRGVLKCRNGVGKGKERGLKGGSEVGAC